MPLYEVNCPYCGMKELFIKEATGLVEAPCPECGASSPRNWQACGSPFEFRSYWSEGISTGGDPIHVTTREQEKQLLKELHAERVN